MLTKPVKGCPQLKRWAMRIARRAGIGMARQGKARQGKVAFARKLAVINASHTR
jgi:transposase